MKTQRQQVQEKLNEEFFGHPSREEQDLIRRLGEIVIDLAEQIDILKSQISHD